MSTQATQQRDQTRTRLTYSASKGPGKSYVTQYDGETWRNVATAEDAALGHLIAALLTLAARLGWDADTAEHLAGTLDADTIRASLTTQDREGPMANCEVHADDRHDGCGPCMAVHIDDLERTLTGLTNSWDQFTAANCTEKQVAAAFADARARHADAFGKLEREDDLLAQIVELKDQLAEARDEKARLYDHYNRTLVGAQNAEKEASEAQRRGRGLLEALDRLVEAIIPSSEPLWGNPMCHVSQRAVDRAREALRAALTTQDRGGANG